MAMSVQEAVAAQIATLAVVMFLAAGVLRLARLDKIWTGVLVPAAFLGAYWFTYNKIPSFPPVGAVNKVFYVAATGTLLGLALDHFGSAPWRRAIILTQPVGIAFYIGQARIADGLFEVVLAALGGVFALVFLLHRTVDEGPGSDVDRAIVLAIASLGFAPIALLGASSSGFQLCLSLAAAVLASLVWHLRRPVFLFGAAATLGGYGGLLAAIDTVTLVTRKADNLAIAILYLIIFAPIVSNLVSDAAKIKNGIARRAILSLACLAPAGAAALIAVVSYPTTFPT